MVRTEERPRQLQARGDCVTDRLARVRQVLTRVIDAMNDPAFELDANEGAGVIAAFNLARGAGLAFDQFTTALVGVLRRQIAETSENGDADVDVADFENDDPARDDDAAEEEDVESSGLEPWCGPVLFTPCRKAVG